MHLGAGRDHATLVNTLPWRPREPHSMKLSSRDRVMVLAPHPDDETLGAGGLLQRAAACDAASRIVFVTDGDDNPWPQRVVERRLRIDADARARWGARRRAEGYAALDALGVPRDRAVFLGYPDQGLTGLLVHAPSEMIARLRAEITTWRPTIIVMPSLRDRHPDHNALAVLTLEALATLAADERPLTLTYVVHPFSMMLFRDGFCLHLTPHEQERKRLAIERHATQLLFRRWSYRRAASPVESLATVATPLRPGVRATLESAVVDGTMLRIRLATRFLLRPALLRVVGWTTAARHFALLAKLSPGRRTAVVYDGRSRAVFGSVRRYGVAGGLAIDVPLSSASIGRCFVKLTMRSLFFDTDGWIEAVVEPRDRATGCLYGVIRDGMVATR